MAPSDLVPDQASDRRPSFLAAALHSFLLSAACRHTPVTAQAPRWQRPSRIAGGTNGGRRTRASVDVGRSRRKDRVVPRVSVRLTQPRGKENQSSGNECDTRRNPHQQTGQLLIFQGDRTRWVARLIRGIQHVRRKREQRAKYAAVDGRRKD